MHTKEQLKKISETYFQALRDKNFSAIPFSDDIAFRAPLAPGGSQNPIKRKKMYLNNGGNHWSQHWMALP